MQAGPGDFLQVVCGAPNVAQGQSIALLRVGQRLPVDGKKLKKTKIRGEASEGMICSERELGISEEHDGILVLDTDVAPGTPLLDVLPARDTLIDIDNKSLTHRPDLWGHYGFARELAAIYGRELKPHMTQEGGERLAIDVPASGEEVPINIAPSRGLCPRYTGLVMRDVVVGPSPAWLRFLLLAIGQRPINNVVDLTNFILHDLGQPMHAFDLDRLAGPEIVVRLAEPGERIRTLDAVDRTLTADDLLICDGDRPVALAGVMGGEGTMVEPGTNAVFLESASFDAATIRRTSTRVGLRTDSSAHFEKSLDPTWAATGATKFAALLQQLSPTCRIAGPMSDPGGWSFDGRTVRLRTARASKVLGIDIAADRAREYLEPLGFTLNDAGEGSFDVDVPSWRATKDIEIEEDLIEEIGRRHRYDEVEPLAPRARVEPIVHDPELTLVRKLRECLAYECGYDEAYNYSFLPDDLCAKLDLEDRAYARVGNAVAAHMTRMRCDVLPSLLGSLPVNLRSQEVVPLFEVGKGYRPEVDGEERDGKKLPFEVIQACGALVDQRKEAESPCRTVRGHVEHLLGRMGRPALPVRRLSDSEAAQISWMHPGRTAVFHDPDNDFRIVAYVGALHPSTVAALDITAPGEVAAAFCIDVRELLRMPEVEQSYEPLAKFPSQPVDLAFLVDESTTVAELTRLCREANPKLVRAVDLFEVYRGQGLPEGKKSLNFTVTLSSPKRTLTAEDEERYITRVREAAAEAGAELRG